MLVTAPALALLADSRSVSWLGFAEHIVARCGVAFADAPRTCFLGAWRLGVAGRGRTQDSVFVAAKLRTEEKGLRRTPVFGISVSNLQPAVWPAIRCAGQKILRGVIVIGNYGITLRRSMKETSLRFG